MRRRLTGSLLALLLGGGISVAAALPVRAQAPEDTESWGDLLGDGAEVGAFEETGGPGNEGGGGSGGGGGGATITCLLTRVSGGGNDPVTRSQLETEYSATGQQPITVARACRDAIGQIVIDDVIQWTPAVGDPVSPEWLAELARDRIELPHPAARMAPSPSVGTTAQLPTYFWVTNWPSAPLHAEASAGTVTAWVDATAVRQTWRIRDELRGETDTENCGATAGVAFDPANPEAAGSCGWTPQHSSAGQPSDHPTTGEPCFDASVTVYWSLSWDSNVTEPEDLGTVPMTSTACIVVAEVQAVVSSSP